MVRLVKGAYWDGEIKRAQEAGPARLTRCSPTSTTPIWPTWPARRRCWPRRRASMASSPPTTPAPSPPLRRWRRPPGHVAFECSACTAWAKACTARCCHPRHRAAHLRPGGRAPRPAGLPGAPAAGKRRQLVLRAPAGRRRGAAVGAAAPRRCTPRPGRRCPPALYGASRANSPRARPELPGRMRRTAGRPGRRHAGRGTAGPAGRRSRPHARLHAGPGLAARPVAERAARAAPRRRPAGRPAAAFCGLLVKEAGKTWGDAVSEVRGSRGLLPLLRRPGRAADGRGCCPAPTGERNPLRLRGRGVFVCISPWNFPLAIFAGQVVAALVAGNAWPPSRPSRPWRWRRPSWNCCTPPACPPTRWRCCTARAKRWAPRWWRRPHGRRVLHRQHAGGAAHQAQRWPRDGPIVPLIAETGGLNAMVVDSTALPDRWSTPWCRAPSAAPASAARRCACCAAPRHCRRRDRDDGRRHGRAALGVATRPTWPPTSAR